MEQRRVADRCRRPGAAMVVSMAQAGQAAAACMALRASRQNLAHLPIKSADLVPYDACAREKFEGSINECPPLCRGAAWVANNAIRGCRGGPINRRSCSSARIDMLLSGQWECRVFVCGSGDACTQVSWPWWRLVL